MQKSPNPAPSARYRPHGHVSESRGARYVEAEQLGKGVSRSRAASSQDAKGDSKGAGKPQGKPADHGQHTHGAQGDGKGGGKSEGKRTDDAPGHGKGKGKRGRQLPPWQRQQHPERHSPQWWWHGW